MSQEQTTTAIERDQPLFLGGVSFDEIKIPPDQSTEPKSLSDRGKRIKYTFVDNLKYTFTLLRYGLGIFYTSALHTILYGLIFAVAFFASGPLSKLIGQALPALDQHQQWLGYGFMAACLFFVFALLNFFRLLGIDESWRERRNLHAKVNLSLLRRPHAEFDKSVVVVWPDEMHFGLLNVRYGYTNDTFYVLGGTNALACAIDLDLIRKVDETRDPRWRSKRGTPGVIVVVGTGSMATKLCIHGTYFEDDEDETDGKQAVQEFVQGLTGRCKKIPPTP